MESNYFGDFKLQRNSQSINGTFSDLLIENFVLYKMRQKVTTHRFSICLYKQNRDLLFPTIDQSMTNCELSRTLEDIEDGAPIESGRDILVRAKFLAALDAIVEDMKCDVKVVYTSLDSGLLILDGDDFDSANTVASIGIRSDHNIQLSIVSTEYKQASDVVFLFDGIDNWSHVRNESSQMVVGVWWSDHYGWSSREVPLACDNFDAYLDANYSDKVASSTRTLIDRVIGEKLIGKLVLCHGNAGTGKSFWIRGLSVALKQKYDVAYISEFESFLSSAAGYYQVVDEDRPVVFVFEDAGCVFAVDAQNRYEQLTTTLLNLTSGLISAGRKDIFVFTYNGAMGDMDEAMIRPGRALSVIKFGELDSSKANAFLKAHGSDECVCSSMRLADLYAMIYGFDDVLKESRGVLGF